MFIKASLQKLNHIDGFLYISLLLIVIYFRVQVLELFSFKWTDGDQVLMWYGAKEFAQGLVHETRFYGQSYNSMFESIIAAPFYRSGFDINKLLPTITSILSLFPFILISINQFIKGSTKNALIIVSIPLILPINYWLITSIPRGFVTGIFFSSFLFICLGKQETKIAYFVAFFLLVLSYSINPNSVLFSVPCVFYLVMQNYTRKYIYRPSLLGLAGGILIHFLLNLFYLIHPNYNLHVYSLKYSLKNMLIGIQKTDLFFRDIAIISPDFGTSTLVLLSLFTLYFWVKKEKKKSFSIGISVIIIFFSLSLDKIHDAIDSVFYSYSRMYLALPLTLALAISFLEIKRRTWLVYLYLLIPITCIGINYQNLTKKIEFETNTKKNHVVSIRKVDEIKEECIRLKRYAVEKNIDLIIIGFDWRNTLCGYGCAACVDSFPKTLFPLYERRTWRMLEDAKVAYKNILIIDVALRIDTLLANVENVDEQNNFYLIKNNQLKTFELLDSIGMAYRPFIP